MTICFALDKCSLGNILVAQSEKGICAILLGDEPAPLKADLHRRFPAATLVSSDAKFQNQVADVLFAIEQAKFTGSFPLDSRGTLFQQRVWQALLTIPVGETRSYSEIAETIGSPSAARAVASACAANPIAILIPCHRVVRSDGGLSGYRWGIERKKVLLQREALEVSSNSAARAKMSEAQ